MKKCRKAEQIGLAIFFPLMISCKHAWELDPVQAVRVGQDASRLLLQLRTIPLTHASEPGIPALGHHTAECFQHYQNALVLNENCNEKDPDWPAGRVVAHQFGSRYILDAVR